MRKEYEFRVNNYIERQWFRTNTKLKVEENILKINQIEDFKSVIRVYPNPTGEYEINSIKAIRLSSIFLIYKKTIIALIIMTLAVLITVLFTFSVSIDIINIYIVFWLICIFCSGAKGIKIVFKDNKKLYIPVATLRFESIEYKKDVMICIEDIKLLISNWKNIY